MPAKKGLYANIQAKRKRIAKGSGEKMRKPNEKGAPSKKDFQESEKTATKPTAKAKAKRKSGGGTGKSTTGKKSGSRKKSSSK